MFFLGPKKLQPDVLLLGLNSHDQNSLRSVEILKQHFPKSKLILMGALPPRGYLLRILKSGLSGLVLKDATFGEFLKTVRSVDKGATVLPPHLIGSSFHRFDGPGDGNLEFSDTRMTRREREVSKLIAEGLSNKEIAQRLHIATYTVKSHVHNILQKLSLKTRLQILAYAHKHGISTPIQYNPADAPFLTQKN